MSDFQLSLEEIDRLQSLRAQYNTKLEELRAINREAAGEIYGITSKLIERWRTMSKSWRDSAMGRRTWEWIDQLDYTAKELNHHPDVSFGRHEIEHSPRLRETLVPLGSLDGGTRFCLPDHADVYMVLAQSNGWHDRERALPKLRVVHMETGVVEEINRSTIVLVVEDEP